MDRSICITLPQCVRLSYKKRLHTTQKSHHRTSMKLLRLRMKIIRLDVRESHYYTKPSTEPRAQNPISIGFLPWSVRPRKTSENWGHENIRKHRFNIKIEKSDTLKVPSWFSYRIEKKKELSFETLEFWSLRESTWYISHRGRDLFSAPGARRWNQSCTNRCSRHIPYNFPKI